MTTPPRAAAFTPDERVTTLIDGRKYVGVIATIFPPDADYWYYRYTIRTASGMELKRLAENTLHRAPTTGEPQI